MDWGKIALLFFFPFFLLGVLSDKFGIHILPTAYTRIAVFILLGIGTICVVVSWVSRHPQNSNIRFLATLFFVLLDLYVTLSFAIAQFWG